MIGDARLKAGVGTMDDDFDGDGDQGYMARCEKTGPAVRCKMLFAVQVQESDDACITRCNLSWLEFDFAITAARLTWDQDYSAIRVIRFVLQNTRDGLTDLLFCCE